MTTPHTARLGQLKLHVIKIKANMADGPGAKIVARAQGLHIGSGMTNENWFMCFSMVFVDERYGST
jgi:hypothetical protein